jgi:hypothetical protein
MPPQLSRPGRPCCTGREGSTVTHSAEPRQQHSASPVPGVLCYRDRLRNQRLIELGWTVMRFWVYELRDALPDCLARVQRWRASIDQAEMGSV